MIEDPPEEGPYESLKQRLMNGASYLESLPEIPSFDVPHPCGGQEAIHLDGQDVQLTPSGS